jgi:O-antigen ligase
MPAPQWHLRFSLGALCLMLIVPFLNPHHYNPIPTFYPEWIAAALGLLAASLLLRSPPLTPLELPSVALAPLGIIGLLLIQLISGQVLFVTQALLFLLYLLWAVALICLGYALRQRLGLDALIEPLSIALLTGACLTAIMQAIQLAYPFFGALIGLNRTGMGGAGNLAQANHFANYLWLGLASAIYLCVRGRLGQPLFALLAVALIASASLTGSRSVLLYAFGFALLAGWAAWRTQQASLRMAFRLALFLCASTLLIQFAFSFFEIGKALGATVSGTRIYQEASSGGVSQRLQLWRTGLAMFMDHPWLGAGIGQFPWQAYLLVGARPDGTYLGGGEHAHNLFIDLLAEFGIIAPVIVLAVMLHWWLAFSRQRWTAAHGWIASVLLIQAIHSQLEYPLWYTFFLGIAALALGAGSMASLRPKISTLSQPIIAMVFLLGSVTLLNLFIDYRRLEHTLNWQLQSVEDAPSWEKTLQTLKQLHSESLFSHYVDLAYAHHSLLNRDALKDKILISERALRFSPVDQITYKLAYFLALDGRANEARLALERALATHPKMRLEAIRQLKESSMTYEELKPLLLQLENINPASTIPNDHYEKRHP